MTHVSQIRKDEIPAGGSEVWSGVQFHIPPLPPSDLVYCRIIEIKYYIVVGIVLLPLQYIMTLIFHAYGMKIY